MVDATAGTQSVGGELILRSFTSDSYAAVMADILDPVPVWAVDQSAGVLLALAQSVAGTAYQRARMVVARGYNRTRNISFRRRCRSALAGRTAVSR